MRAFWNRNRNEDALTQNYRKALTEMREVRQVLASALGYTTDEHGIVDTEDNSDMSLAMEAARTLKEVQEENFDLWHLVAVGKLEAQFAEAGRWVELQYDDVFTPDGEPIRPDYRAICEDWHDFSNRSHDTLDGYEYAVCRRKAAAGGE